jgi:hypothetical protein
MKAIKYILFRSICFFSIINATAQDTLKFNGIKDFTDYLTTEYRNKYPSVQFLKHKLITPVRNIYDNYTGTRNTDSVSSSLVYMGIANDINISSFRNEDFIKLDFLNKKMIEGANKKYAPLSFSFIEYHSFKDSTIFLNLINFQNNRYNDLSPIGFFPFKKEILFASTCLNEIYNTSEITFQLNDSLIFTNLDKTKINSISIDFGDGNNYIPVNTNSLHSVSYSSNGLKIIKVKLIYNNNVYISKSKIQIQVPNPLALSAINLPNIDCFISGEQQDVGPVNISTNIFGNTVSGKYAVWFSGCNTSGKVRKPYIISAGFNPKNIFRLVPGLFVSTNFLSFNIGGNQVSIPTNYSFNFAPRGTYYESYNGTFSERYSPAEFSAFSCTKNGNNFLDRLRDEGYDIVILSYDNGEDKTINNAALFIELIQRINTEKFSNWSFIENVVSGYSGGGVTSRLALALMESRYKQGLGPHPHSKLWISFEGEHQGSNVPIGLQHFIDFQSDPTHIVPSISPIHLLADLANITMANLVKGIVFNNTSSELLAISALSNNQSAPERIALNNILSSIPNNASNGYPEFTRRVAVTQGSGLGINMNFSSSNILDTQLKFDAGTGTAVSFPSGCGGSYTWKMPNMGKNTTALWNNLSNTEVFKANGYLDLGFTVLPMICVNAPFFGCQCTGPFEINAYINLFSKTVAKPSNPPNFDQPASSVLSTHLDVYQFSAYGLYNNVLSGGNSFANKDPNFHAFSPVTSCLDLHDPNTGLPESNFTQIDNTTGGLNLLNINNQAGLFQHPERRFGFPHLSYPSNQYAATPFDGVYCIGTNNGVDLNNNPRPDNQAHVEDPQKFIGDYLARTEVAPTDLFLTNRIIGSTAVNNSGFVGNYVAEFEARNKIIVGKTDMAGNNIYSLYGNQNFLSKNNDFKVDLTCKAIMHSGEFVEFLPGFEVPVGAELDAFIQAYNCADLLFRVNHNSPNVNNNTEPKHNLPNLGFNYDEPINKTANKKINSFLLYPNPNNGSFTYVNVCDGEPTSLMIISNLEGKTVYKSTIYNNNPIDLNLNQLINGLYLVKIINKSSSDNFKLTINN